LFDDATCSMLLAAIDEGRVFTTRHGRVAASNLGLTLDRVPRDAREPIGRAAADQSNTSVLFDRRLIMKVFRRVEPGPNPDVEIGRYLMERRFSHVPPLAGTLEYAREGSDAAAVAMLQEFVRNEGNGWDVTINELGRYFERRAGRPLPTMTTDDAAVVRDAIGTYLNTAEVIGRRTGELHVAMASSAAGNEAFAPDTQASADVAKTAVAMKRHASEQLDLLERSLDRLDDRKRALAQKVLGRRRELLRQFEELRELKGSVTRIRCHGDYHLGQILVSEGDIIILDFEGEPARPLAERRRKSSPLRDVAGMVRSFSYAALTGLGAATQNRPEDYDRLAPWAEFWERWVTAAFLRAYLAAAAGAPFVPSRREDFDLLLHTFILDKAIYELAYELNNRPDWVHIPLTGLLKLRAPLHA
jgi:maltose alpha-D-glucosyltransferase/alpha-amylase